MTDLLNRPWLSTPGDTMVHLSDGTRTLPPHLELLSDKIARGIARGGMRLIIEEPPRHGKTEEASRWTPAWFLALWPHKRVILTSYEADFAAQHGRYVRDILERHGAELDVSLDERTTAGNRWNLTAGGGMQTAGAGGPITGKGADLFIIDDPVKNQTDALSETQRERLWDWWQTTARTRIEPGGSIIVIMCMTGDTPVMMADGTERPLRGIRVGDRVATYDDGRLGVSTVRNHKSSGPDRVFEIRTTCGRVVRANERHPFLVLQNGQLQWIRLRNLSPGLKIVAARGSGGSGGERPVSSMSAPSPLARGDTAVGTTARRLGQTATVHPQRTLDHAVTPGSSTVTGSRGATTTRWSRPREDCARYARSPQGRTFGLTGEGSCASTIATKLRPSGAYCATTATSPSATPRQRRQPEQWLSTSDFTTAQIESIEPVGVEEVFDVQIDGTENFIANGLVSHNTRWHEDDLVGRLLRTSLEDPNTEQWDRVRFPAICELPPFYDVDVNGPYQDELGRRPGEALWPERYSVKKLLQIKAGMSAHWWSALYQQNPIPIGDSMFQREWFRRTSIPAPASANRCRMWDLAGGTRKRSDYTVGALVAHDGPNSRTVIEDIARTRLQPGDVEKLVVATAHQDGKDVKVRIQQDPGQAGKAQIAHFVRLLVGFDVDGYQLSGGKVPRAGPLAAQAQHGNVEMLTAPWNKAFLDEATTFPHGRFDDQIDATAAALDVVAGGRRRVFGDPGRTRRADERYSVTVPFGDYGTGAPKEVLIRW